MNIDNLTESAGINSESKSGVSRTKISAGMGHLGYAAREIFVQFLVRISKEIPNVTLAMFSKLKYVNAPNFEHFRKQWTAQYLSGFVVHSKAFDQLKGDFPIGFLIWDTGKKKPSNEITTIALDKDGKEVGEKTFYRKIDQLPLSEWIVRPRSNTQDALPLKNAITPTTSTKDVRGNKWANGAIGSMIVFGNDLQHAAQGTALLSSGYGNAGAFFVTAENLWKAAVVFAVRRLVKPTWLNDRDQFLQPTQPLTEIFKSDSLIWMLFNGSNLSAGAKNLEWDGRKWNLLNNFIPFTEEEVGASNRFDSNFMSEYIAKLKLSSEAKLVLEEGRKIWKLYHSNKFDKRIRDEFKLNCSSVGWYQIRKSLEANDEVITVDFDSFKEAYSSLSQKLLPQVFKNGFLKI